ncbi:helix-turn-helix domain-containing protein [Chloroflexota bacterium]
MTTDDRRLTTGDIMKYCHVSRSTALKWIKSNKLSAYFHPGGQYRITRRALLEFLERYGMPIDETLLDGDGAQKEEGAQGRKKGKRRKAASVSRKNAMPMT